MQILLVEDNVALAQALQQGLFEYGHVITVADTGAEALAQHELRPFDVVVLDLGLPDMDGMEVLHALRGPAIVVLTARDAVESRIAALDAGADDYLIKPFAFAELLARIHAVARRTAISPRAIPAISAIGFDETLRVTIDGVSIELPPRQHALLRILVLHHDHVVRREDILRSVFGYNFDPGTNLIDVHLTHLRRRLAGTAVTIQTVRGIGLKLNVQR